MASAAPVKTTDRLKYYTLQANKQQKDDNTSNLLLNLSIREILLKMSTTFNHVLNELLEWNKPLTAIFLSEDRLMYCGLMMVVVSFILWIASP